MNLAAQVYGSRPTGRATYTLRTNAIGIAAKRTGSCVLLSERHEHRKEQPQLAGTALLP